MTIEPITITLAVPTFNRIDKLKVLIGSIESQIGNETFKVRLVISNSESNDGTLEYIEQLRPFGTVSEIIKFNQNAPSDQTRPDNWQNLFKSIPPDGGWVWLLGDDDFLVRPNCLASLVSVLIEKGTSSIDVIHLTQARRSTGSKAVKRKNLVEAADEFGFLELLGWMSSIAIRSDLIQQTFVESFYGAEDEPYLSSPEVTDEVLKYRLSAFRHSAQILKSCSKSDILIIDDFFAEPQDDIQTAETRRRWELEAMNLRYMFVVDDIEYLRKNGAIRGGVCATFFRYHTSMLWDRFVHYVVSHLLSHGELDEYCNAFLHRLVRIESLLANPAEIQLFRLWRFGFFSAIEDALKQRQRYIETCAKLEETVTLSFKGVYSFNTFQ